MTHKVHPKAFRIKNMADFNVRGFYYGPKIHQYLEEDVMIKNIIRNKFSEASIANIEIDHYNNKIIIIIDTARPGLIIGRGGGGVEGLKIIIEKKIKNLKKGIAKIKTKLSENQVKIEIREVKNPWLSAMLVAQWAASQIEKRNPFRKVLKMAIEKVMQNKEIKGVKIKVSGRLNGVEIARKEWLKQGRMPLGTIRANIDYAQTEAYCTYGVIGVKVWMYKGEKFDN